MRRRGMWGREQVLRQQCWVDVPLTPGCGGQPCVLLRHRVLLALKQGMAIPDTHGGRAAPPSPRSPLSPPPVPHSTASSCLRLLCISPHPLGNARPQTSSRSLSLRGAISLQPAGRGPPLPGAPSSLLPRKPRHPCHLCKRPNVVQVRRSVASCLLPQHPAGLPVGQVVRLVRWPLQEGPHVRVGAGGEIESGEVRGWCEGEKGHVK
jgi:hypothetical protein